MKPLNPVMAALWAASSAAIALPGISRAAAAPAVCPPAETETNPVNILSCLIARDADARKDIGERLARFVQGKDAKGRSYLTPELSADEKVLPGVAAAAKGWPDANKGDPGKIATLYFVIGPDGALPPSLAKSPALAKELASGMTWSARLQDALANAHWTDSKQVAQSRAASDVIAFLNDAAEKAQKVLADHRAQKDVLSSVEQHDTTEPNAAMGHGRPKPSSGSGDDPNYQEKGMYETGVVQGNVSGPHDETYRTLSMKIYSTRDANGDMINQIGIVDITRGKDGQLLPDALDRVQFVSLVKQGETAFSLRDGGRKYVVNVDGDKVTLMRPDSKDGDATLSTTLTALKQARNEQIRGAGMVEIGGDMYYTIAQGGQKASALFFSAADMSRDDANPKPALMAEVTRALSDGSTEPILNPPGPDLGKLNGKDSYHLEYDGKTRRWSVKPGEGYQPPKTDAAKKTGHGGKDGKNGKGGKDGKDAPQSLADAVALATKGGNWTEGDGNDTISDDMKDKFKIMKDEDGVAWVISTEIPPDYALHLKGDPDMRAFGKYVVVETDKDAVYYDIPALAAIAAGDAKSAKPSGQFLKGSREIRDVKDVDVAEDMLRAYLNRKDIDLKPGVKKYGSKGRYTISAGGSGKAFAVRMIVNEKQDCEIWPKLDAKCKDIDGKASGKPDQEADLDDGSAKAYGGCIKEVSESGKATRTLYAGSDAAKQSAGVENDNVCLYQFREGSKPPQYSLTLYFEGANGLEKRMAYLFNGDLKKPDRFTYKSLGRREVKDASQAQISLVQGSDSKRGVYGLFRSGSQSPVDGPASQLKDKAANCLGAVVWWGAGEEEALKACQEGRINESSWWSKIKSTVGSYLP